MYLLFLYAMQNPYRIFFMRLTLDAGETHEPCWEDFRALTSSSYLYQFQTPEHIYVEGHAISAAQTESVQVTFSASLLDDGSWVTDEDFSALDKLLENIASM